jgi:hypothetical protein
MVAPHVRQGDEGEDGLHRKKRRKSHKKAVGRLTTTNEGEDDAPQTTKKTTRRHVKIPAMTLHESGIGVAHEGQQSALNLPMYWMTHRSLTNLLKAR